MRRQKASINTEEVNERLLLSKDCCRSQSIYQSRLMSEYHQCVKSNGIPEMVNFVPIAGEFPHIFSHFLLI